MCSSRSVSAPTCAACRSSTSSPNASEVSAPAPSPVANRALSEFDIALGELHQSMTDPDFGARYFREVASDLVVAIVRVASLLDGREPVAAEHLLNARVIGGRPQDDPGYAARVDELASPE